MTYVWYKTWNNISSYLTSAISASSHSIMVNDWGIFPSSFPYLLTIEQQLNGVAEAREIVKVTAKNGNTLTVVRAVEPCVGDDTANPKTITQVAHNFEAWSTVALTMTAWTLEDVQEWIDINAQWIVDCNARCDDLDDRIDNIEEDIALLQNL